MLWNWGLQYIHDASLSYDEKNFKYVLDVIVGSAVISIV